MDSTIHTVAIIALAFTVVMLVARTIYLQHRVDQIMDWLRRDMDMVDRLEARVNKFEREQEALRPQRARPAGSRMIHEDEWMPVTTWGGTMKHREIKS